MRGGVPEGGRERQEGDPRLPAQLAQPFLGVIARERRPLPAGASLELGPQVVVHLDRRGRRDQCQRRPARRGLLPKRPQQGSRDRPRMRGRLRLGLREHELDGLERPAPGAQAGPRLTQRAFLPDVEAARPIEPLRHGVGLEGERQLSQSAVRVEVEVEPRRLCEREAVVRQVVAHPEHQHHEVRRVAGEHLAVERELAAGARARDARVHHVPRHVRARGRQDPLERAGERALLRGRDGRHHRVADERDALHARRLGVRTIGPAQAVAVEAQVHLAVALGDEDARREVGQEALPDDAIGHQQRRAAAPEETDGGLGGDQRQRERGERQRQVDEQAAAACRASGRCRPVGGHRGIMARVDCLHGVCRPRTSEGL